MIPCKGLVFLTLFATGLLVSSCIIPTFDRKRIKYTYSHQGLHAIPDSVFLRKDLQVLDLFRNKIDSIPDAIENLTELEELYLGSNNLVYISSKITKLKKLKILSVQFNDLKYLPEAIFDLENLEQLLAANNKFTTLSPSIGKLKSLERLTLNYNQLKELPEELGGCTSLRFVNLSMNALERIPESMGELPYLNELHVNGSGFMVSIPESFCRNRYLELLVCDRTTVLPSCLLVRQTTRLKIVYR
jgi:Leucine-rich repeat (LRR) protein